MKLQPMVFVFFLISVSFVWFYRYKVDKDDNDLVFYDFVPTEKQKQISDYVSAHVEDVQEDILKMENPLYSTYIVKDDIIHKDVCDWIIYESEKYAAKEGWTTKRHENYPTVDNKIEDIEPIYFYVNNIVYQKLIPLFAEFDIDPMLLGLHDLFIIKYSIGGQEWLEKHTDGDDFSFIVALNDDFEGGGTLFTESDSLVRCKKGSAVLFSGQNPHMGVPITKGTRYILAGFLHYGFEHE